MSTHQTPERVNASIFLAEDAHRFPFQPSFFFHSLLLALPLWASCAIWQVRAEQPRQQVPFQVEQREYQGWRDAVWLSNGKVEAIVVPSIGRVMQFRALGDEGVFWENPAFLGKAVEPNAKDWGNFGGDKPWPAPQADWPKVTGRGWPPPIGFDASSWEVTTGAGSVEVRSPVDPHYGVKVTRSIRLKPDAMVMDIATRYDKVKGEPCEIAIWVVTQLKHPESMWFPIPKGSRFEKGYDLQSKDVPKMLSIHEGNIRWQRDPMRSAKIGSDGSELNWVGKQFALKMESPRMAGAKYPDNGCSVEIYTNPDPLPYIELEMLGPLSNLKVGDSIEASIQYTLTERSATVP